jgi:hypothetical protein
MLRYLLYLRIEGAHISSLCYSSTLCIVVSDAVGNPSQSFWCRVSAAFSYVARLCNSLDTLCHAQ